MAHSVLEPIQQKFDQTSLTAIPLGPRLGAEVQGLNLADGFTSETHAEFVKLLTEHKVLVLRNQHLSTKKHVEISHWFGELEVHPFRPEGEFPEIMLLDNDKDNPVLSTDVWHSDTTFRIKPTKYTILHCQIMPRLGGDTLWCDMEAVYNSLSEPFRAFIDPLKARHDFKNFRALFTNSTDDRKRLREMEELYPNPLHPVVRTHPLSGRKCVYVNPQFTLHIDGLTKEESSALLEVLFQPVSTPEFQFRHSWQEGDVVFWDNMSTQHYAANDYYPQRRKMERTAVCGDEPF